MTLNPLDLLGGPEITGGHDFKMMHENFMQADPVP